MTEEQARKIAIEFTTDSGCPTDVINHYMTEEERQKKIEDITKALLRDNKKVQP